MSMPSGGGSVNDVQLLLDVVVVDEPAYVDSSSSKLNRRDDDLTTPFCPPRTVSMLSRLYSPALRQC